MLFAAVALMALPMLAVPRVAAAEEIGTAIAIGDVGTAPDDAVGALDLGRLWDTGEVGARLSRIITFADLVLDYTNEYRVRNGRQRLARNAALQLAATRYAQTMARTNCFSHTCPPVRDMSQRAVQAGYRNWRALGENIAYGYRSPEAVMRGWINSAGHRRNILNPSFQELGVGYATNRSGTLFWVQNFGARFR